jgi:hypothetical protein
MQPKAYRIAPGLFELIEEPSDQTKLSRKRQLQSPKVISSGKPWSVRLPKEIVQEYGLSGPLVLEKTPDGLLLRQKKLSWEETALQMAQVGEDWSAFDVAIADGLNGEP